MNGRRSKNKKMVLDSGVVSHHLEKSFKSNNFNMNRFLTQKFNIHNFKTSLEKIKRNESQIEDSFQILH